MKTKYTLSVILSAALLTRAASAQVPVQAMNANPVMADEASFLNPAYLKNTSKLQINILPFMNGHFQAANSLLSTNDLISVFNIKGSDEENPGIRPINKALDNLKAQNTVNAMLDLTLLHIASQFGNQTNPWHAGFSVRQHIQSQVKVNEQFLRLLFEGNKQYAGTSVSLEPDVHFLSYTDFGISFSKTLNISGFTLTPAIRLRYLMAEAAIYTNHDVLELYTEENGEYLEVSGQLDGYAGGMVSFGKIINDDGTEDGDLDITPAGKGLGIDLGLSVEYKNFSLSMASIDNGKIKFKGESAWYISSQGTAYKWEGYDISADLNGQESSEGFTPFDSLNLSATQQDFAVRIGSKLTVNANYGLKKNTDKKGTSYFKHNLGFSLIKGAKSRFNPEIPDWLAIYYQYNTANRFTAGINYNKCLGTGDIGANIGLRAASLNIGLGSNSLLAFLNPGKSKKANIFFHLGFAF